MPTALLVHDVYFTLNDPSPAARQALVRECYDRLAAIAGILHFAAGSRDAELARPVNDVDYDVSLHVWFVDRAAHDAYQVAPAHVAFVAANGAKWRRVRVFDSAIAPR
ncbi:MAG: Dabb family protein [Planctomycetota bacterium]